MTIFCFAHVLILGTFWKRSPTMTALEDGVPSVSARNSANSASRALLTVLTSSALFSPEEEEEDEEAAAGLAIRFAASVFA